MTIKNTFPWFSEEQKELYLSSCRKILDSGVLICGENTKLLENEAKKICNSDYAVAVSSGTAALEIIFKYLNIEDCEILIPNNTFISTLYAVQNAKGIPVLVDIDPHTFCVDINDVYKKINSKTKVLLLVHIAGYIPANVEELKRICADNNIYLVEDSSHAFGASYQNNNAGSIGIGSACSLYPTKIVTGGTGGVLTTNDKGLYEFALLLRAHGNDSAGRNILLSPNWMISELNALLCLIQMKNIKEIISRRQLIASSYKKVIEKNSLTFSTQPYSDERVHPYYKYVVKCPNVDFKIKIADYFQNRSIILGHCYETPLSEHPSTKALFEKSLLTNSLDFATKHFTLPCHLGLNSNDIDAITDTLEEFTNKYCH